MKTALVLLAFAASASAASLAGVSVESSTFNIVNVNPSSGAAIASQKSLVTRPSGTLGYNNVRVDGDDMVWSLQTSSDGAAVLASQDLRVNGRREDCMISSSAKPIVIFNDEADASVSAVAVSSTGTFGIYKFAINPNNRYCTSTLIESFSSINSVSATASAQFGNNIFFATEASTLFSSTSGAQIRGYTIDGSSATVINTAVSLSGVFVTSIVADSATSVVVTGYDVGTDNTLASWNIDLSTGTVSSTPRTITSTSDEEVSAGAAAYTSSGLYNLKYKRDTTTPSSSTANLGFTDYSSSSTNEVTRSTAISNGVFALFELSDAVYEAVDTETSASDTVTITGDNLYAATASSSSLSKCRVTVGSLDATETTATGSATANGVSCPFTAPTTSTTDGTVIKVEFAADGVNYAGSISFNYGASSAASVRFTQASYSLDDGVAFPSNRAPISAEFFDASGNKLLFTTTALSGAISVESSDASLRLVSGNSASAAHGRLEFPNFAVDVYSTTTSDNVANLKLTVSGATNTDSATATVRVVTATRGSLAALSLASATFSYSVVNPLTGTSLALGDRSLTTDNTIAFGLSAFDNDNIVLNTVELSSSNVPYLVGQAIRTSVSGQLGADSCIIPTTSGVQDTPVKIAYEATATDGSTTFLGLVVLDGVTGTNYQIVRYSRAASSTTTTTCTKEVVDQLPQSELAYAHAEFLNNGRVALIERDTIFSTSQTASLNVWKMTSGTTAGSWQIRNKALGFSVVGITQAGDDDLAISGSLTSNGITTSGVWRVDISDQTSTPIAPSSTKDKFTTDNEQAYFLAAGSADAPSDARYFTTVTQTSAGVRNTDAVQLFNADAVAADATSAAAASDFISFFNYNDASVTAVSPTSLSSSVTVSVTASNVINSSSLKCRFTADGLASFETSVASTSATPAFATDGASYDCGSFPTTLLGDRAVFVQLSNDGGANYGAPACIAVGSGSCPSINGVTATATAVAVPVTNTGLDITRTKAFISRTLPFSTANCASILTLVQTEMAAQSITLSGRNECLAIDSTTIATGRLRSLNTGTQQNVEFTDAAEKAKVDTHLATTAGQAFLTTNGLEASDVTTTAVAEDEDDDLTDGEIAGIVIGSIAGVALIGALIAFALKGSSSSSAAPAAAPAATYAARDVTAGSSSGSYDSTSGSYDSDYSSGSYDSEDYSGSYDGSTGSYSDYV